MYLYLEDRNLYFIAMTVKKNTCCFTGHRPQKLPWGYDEEWEDCIRLKIKLGCEIEKLRKKGVTTFISGMAIGVDMWAAQIVLDLKLAYPQDTIELFAAIPFEGQANKWSSDYRERYFNILAQADGELTLHAHYTKSCMHERKPTLPTHVALDTSCGLHMDSIVLMEQLRTIDKRRLGKHIGILGEKQMKAIDKAISASVSNDTVKRMFTEKDIQVLCPGCAANLRDSSEYIVLRSNPFQTEREACSICSKPDGSPNGYDYFVKQKQQ